MNIYTALFFILLSKTSLSTSYTYKDIEQQEIIKITLMGGVITTALTYGLYKGIHYYLSDRRTTEEILEDADIFYRKTSETYERVLGKTNNEELQKHITMHNIVTEKWPSRRFPYIAERNYILENLIPELDKHSASIEKCKITWKPSSNIILLKLKELRTILLEIELFIVHSIIFHIEKINCHYPLATKIIPKYELKDLQ